MSFFDLVILAVVQGITEFLPVSSSGHLLLVHAVVDGSGTSAAEDLVLDIAVHVGTLFAVLVFFRNDIVRMIRGAWQLLARRGVPLTAESRLFLFILAASVPVAVLGVVLSTFEPDFMRSLNLMAGCLIVFGILMWYADRKGTSDKTVETMTVRDMAVIGLMQMLSLVPGVSRSGITMTAARFCGIGRVEAARFSLLLATVAISGAGLIGGMELLELGDPALLKQAALGAAMSFIAGLAAIALLVRFLAKFSFAAFAVYRIILGVVILILINTGNLS